MNSNIARGKWQQLKGAVSARWGHVTGDHLRVITGRHSQMVGGLHAAYGQAKDEIGHQIDGVHRRSRALYARTGL
jgi:uncharacterized protein YjbJ (UPF0337 family)